MSSASSAVTYTSIYTDSEPRRVFWGAKEELSDDSPSRVIVYGYDGLPMQLVAPPSLDYIPASTSHMIPPTCQSPYSLSIYHWKMSMCFRLRSSHYLLLFHPLLRHHGMLLSQIPGSMRIMRQRMDEDEEDEDVEDDEEDDEEHLAPTDSIAVIPTVELVSSPEETEPVIPPPSTDTTTTGAKITTLMIASTQALIDAVIVALPSPPLPPLPPTLYIPPLIDRMDDIPQTELPPRKKSCLFALGPRHEVGESSTARLNGGRGIDYRDTWVDPAEAVPEIAPITLREESRTRISQRVTIDSQRVELLMKDRIAHQKTIQIVEEEAYTSQEAWAHSIGLSQTQHQVHETRFQMQQAEMAELRETDRRRQAQMVETIQVMGDMRREMGDIQAELLALREQPRRARQPKLDARVSNHQDAPRDADSHI
nr:hypothetical protein [Tanacetum cinerariifolium]